MALSNAHSISQLVYHFLYLFEVKFFFLLNSIEKFSNIAILDMERTQMREISEAKQQRKKKDQK